MSHLPNILVGALLTVILVAAWIWHVRNHPWVKCGKCDGSGNRRTPVLSSRFGNCTRCGGKGKKLRLSARVAGYDLDSGRKRR